MWRKGGKINFYEYILLMIIKEYPTCCGFGPVGVWLGVGGYGRDRRTEWEKLVVGS